MSHTPGPWTYDESEDAIMDSEENHLARVNYAHFEDSYFENCRLIAAAPELLDALILIRTAIGCEDITLDGIWNIADAAIDKATGGGK